MRITQVKTESRKITVTASTITVVDAGLLPPRGCRVEVVEQRIRKFKISLELPPLMQGITNRTWNTVKSLLKRWFPFLRL